MSSLRSLFFFTIRIHPRSTLFPYTTLFRSQPAGYTQGINSVGTGDGTVAGDQFTVNLAAGLDALNYNFGENWSPATDRKSTRLNSSHEWISYAVFCLKKKTNIHLTGSNYQR